MVYRGPDNWQGIAMYMNGQYSGDDKDKSGPVAAASGTLMIGRLFTENNHFGYCKCQVDELLIWNRQLSENEITRVKDGT